MTQTAQAISTRQIAQQLLSLDLDVVNVRREATALAAISRNEAPGRAAEWVEREFDSLVAEISRLLREPVIRGTAPMLYEWELDDPGSGLLIHIRLLERNEEVRHGTESREIMRWIPDLSPRQFERLCSRLLEVYGAKPEHVEVTRLSSDGMLDFFALIEPPIPPAGRRRLTDQPMRIAGQAKRWSGPVDDLNMEAFGGRLLDWRSQAGAALRLVPGWFAETTYSILGVLTSTGGFTSGARQAAAKRLIVPIDLGQMAYDLAASELRHLWLNPQTNTPDQERFVELFPTD